MGNKSSSLATKAPRIKPRDRKRIREQRIQENKTAIRQQMHPTMVSDGGLQEAIQQQVDRGDMALTKKDLVAILLHLRPDMTVSAVQVFDLLTVRDLHVLIRESLYILPTLSSSPIQAPQGDSLLLNGPKDLPRIGYYY